MHKLDEFNGFNDEATKFEVLDLVDQHYLYPDVFNGLDWSIKPVELVSKLDPYSHIIAPGEQESVDTYIASKKRGLGLGLGESADGEIIAEVVEDGPADKAGIKDGDIILKFNGLPIKEITETEFNKMVGTDQQNVHALLKRESKIIEILIEIGFYQSDCASHAIILGKNNKKYGLIEFNSIPENAAIEFFSRLYDLLAQDIEGLIIDLRKNGGGDKHETLKIISAFIKGGQHIINMWYRNKAEKEPTFKGVKIVPENLPIKILQGPNTSSGAEMITAVLKEQRGQSTEILGTNSYGKNLSQRRFSLESGHALYLTTGEWETAKGVNVGKDGVRPDKIIKPQLIDGIDVQLKTAIQLLMSN